MPTGHSHSALLVTGLQRKCEIARGRVSFTTARMALKKAQTTLICQASSHETEKQLLSQGEILTVKIDENSESACTEILRMGNGSICLRHTELSAYEHCNFQ